MATSEVGDFDLSWHCRNARLHTNHTHPPILATNPTTAPPNTSHAEFTLNRNASAALTTAIAPANGVITAARANSNPTNAINATAAAFTPSRNKLAVGDFRNRGNTPAVTATYVNAGTNIPSVASPAPRHPANT
jgi:hypothetical protein